jgi:hypothetical protein
MFMYYEFEGTDSGSQATFAKALVIGWASNKNLISSSSVFLKAC